MAYTTIDKSSDYFNTKLTTGTGSSQAVTGVGFQPDWVWGKRRDSSGHNSLFDSVRGITKGLESNQTGAEFTSTDYYSSFDSDGFTIASGAGGAGNGSGQTAVQWCWLGANGTASNSDGSITSTVSANTTAGFSIVRYTGTGSNATIGHGLGAVPHMYIARNITDTEQWTTYHVGMDTSSPEDYHMRLNTSDARVDEAAVWNDTAPTSSVFSVGDSGAPNGSNDNHIAYCFAEKKGYSKFGSYTGNGNADGTFVYTGFKPAFLMVKRTDASGHYWHIYDNKREPFNPVGKVLYPNRSDAEYAGSNRPDLLSNGFKNRSGNTDINASGGNYIYMAFAENPFVTSTGIPTTAR